MDQPVTALLLALLLLLGNAFFVGAEFAMISARRSQIEPRAEAGSRVAKLALKSMENISLVIGVNQLGITVCSLLLGAVGEPALAHLIEPLLHAAHVSEAWLHPIAFTLSLATVVYLHVVLGEMIPKNIALAGPDLDGLALLVGHTDVDVIASGGVGTLEHLAQLRDLSAGGRSLAGVIVGRALYEQQFTVEAALAAVGDR